MNKKYIIGFVIIVILLIVIWYKNYKYQQFIKTLKYTYSQFEQDLDVIKYFKHKKNGYFIDVGATNGIDISNTYLLEKKYNWNGICIEPHDSTYNDLIRNRDCHTDNSLLFSEKGKEFDFSNAGDIGGITDYIDKHIRAKNSKQTKKTTDTLNNILIKYNAPKYIDYMSLDTEGSELEILKGIDFNKYKFGIMNIEHNFVEPRRSDIRHFLENKGYKYYKEKDVDDYYILIK
jgi:FkbM family methyltransferase